MNIFFTCTLLLLFISRCNARNIQCQELPDRALKAILGTTYNARYMSINPPQDDGTNNRRGGPKRSSPSQIDHGFFIDKDFEDNPYEGIPAWEVDHVEITNQKRRRREAVTPTPSIKKRDVHQLFIDSITPAPKKDVFQSRPWECKSEIHWMDLGPEYFPRYIRTIKCMNKNCWYGHYTCKSKWFSIKVLKRSSGQCAKVSHRLRIVTMDTVTGDFAQQWEFEEKAVTFCCECALNY